MATIPAAGYVSDSARTQGEVKQALEDAIASLRQIPGSGQTELALTITSGSIAPAGSGGVLAIDTEASASTDDLTNIITTNYPDGSCILIHNTNNARFVVVKQAAGGGGQMQLDRSADYALDDTKKWLLLQRRGSDWYEVLRGPNRLAMPTVSQSATFTVNPQDLGKVFVCTGTLTANLLAAASAGNGFAVTIRNVSTGTITIDPNSSELIDGASTISVPSGWSYQIVCDGSAWSTLASTGPQTVESPIINGSMDIWQRGTSFAAIGSGSYAADRWRWSKSGAVVATITRSTSVPTLANAGVLLNYSLEIDITTVDSSIAAGDFATIVQRIEGYNWRYFAQRQFTLSFWVYSPKTGTHCVAFRNNASGTPDRCYVAEYTVNAANTWEYKAITVSASPSAGTWNYTSGAGLEVSFALACGSTYQTTAGAWQTGNFLGTSNQVNVLDNTSNVFRLAAVKMELGSIATPVELREFDAELSKCLRYYQKSFKYGTAPAQNVGVGTGEQQFPQLVGASTGFNTERVHLHQPMVDIPTVTFYNPAAANAQVRNTNRSADCTGTGAINLSEKAFNITATTLASSSPYETLNVHWTADAEL